LTYFGHVIRKEDTCLEKDIIEVTNPGSRRKGKPRTAWMENIKDWT